MRTTKNYKVVDSEFYFNDINDWGCHTKEIATFDTLTEAQWFCEDNCKNYHVLEIHHTFNEDDKIYVEASYVY